MSNINDEEFIEEFEDKAELSEIALVSSLLAELPSLIDAQSELENLDDVFIKLSKMFKALSGSKNRSDDLLHQLEIIKLTIDNNAYAKDKYFQLKRAEREIIKIGNAKIKNKKFSKASALDREKYAVLRMAEELIYKDICKYLNDRYRDDIKTGGYADFTEKDISVFLKKFKQSTLAL